VPSRLVATLLLVVFVAGCNGSNASRSPAEPSPTLTTAPSVPSGPPSQSSAPASGRAPVDESLSAHLQEVVDGLAFEASPGSDAVAAADPSVVANGEAVLTRLAIDPLTGEFAHATLVRLRPGVFDDAWFRQWRDTFTAGACGQAGGVAGNAEAQLGGRTVYIGSCAGGARTYHTWLPDSRVIVSVTSVGERRLGEQVMEGLNE
jgi:hypothetical protein